ncbi:MAG TPA: hypothetical protein VHZ78_06710 [Rhizomicrobium sp.]|jgi:hypothetical protein|nr:hypothetical protein [Rhizomicrobium sp.]
MPFPNNYNIRPTLMGDGGTNPTMTFKNQVSNLVVQPVGGNSIVLCTVFLNLVWTSIAAPGTGNIKVTTVPPCSAAAAATGYCDGGGNFEGFTFASGGNFTMDTNLGFPDQWFLVASFPGSAPINLNWTTNVSLGSGRIRGWLRYLSNETAVTNWLISQGITP